MIISADHGLPSPPLSPRDSLIWDDPDSLASRLVRLVLQVVMARTLMITTVIQRTKIG